MKKSIFCSIFFAAVMLSCKKDKAIRSGIASLTLVNTITGGKAVKLGSRIEALQNYTAAQWALNAGEDDIYVWPIGDSLNPYYENLKFIVEDRAVYSLFLGGIPAAVTGVLVKEEIPYHTDSVGGIRFINLSPNSPALDINLSATPSVNEVSNLAYGQYSSFKGYPAGVGTLPYSFEIRNASTGMVLTTYGFNSSSNLIPRFSNITLVICGLVGGNGAQAFGITRVAHDQ